MRSYEVVARILGLSKQGVQQLERSALEKLRVAFARDCPELRLVFDSKGRPNGIEEVDHDSDAPRVLARRRMGCARSTGSERSEADRSVVLPRVKFCDNVRRMTSTATAEEIVERLNVVEPLHEWQVGDVIYCLHCESSFKAEAVKFDSEGLATCPNAGCDGSPLDWSDEPLW